MLLHQVLRSEGLMDHQVVVTDVKDRRAWLAEHCGGRSVLHVGCCDVPIFDPETNLHIYLARHTDRLDGLDISQEGIAVLRRHVEGDYFTSPEQISKQYDVVLVPEVLEHTPNPREFLEGVFSVVATSYLITAPHIQWFQRTRREGAVFHEQVHGDHRAWYSPYTLLNTLLPFIASERDDIEVFLLESTGSVAAKITTGRVPEPFPARPTEPEADVDGALRLAESRARNGDVAGALRVLERARDRHSDARLVHRALELLLDLGRNMDALRLGVGWMKTQPNDPRCLELCARAFEALGDREQAAGLRALARGR
jgi:hypothetical protein